MKIYPEEIKALNDAYQWHSFQKIKYTNEPYICHPIAVCSLVKSIFTYEDLVCDSKSCLNMIQASLLHDVLEYTECPLSYLFNHYDSEVVQLVISVNNISKPSDGSGVTREKIDREYFSNASQQAQTIKLADLIHNTSSIVKYDVEFAKIYLEESLLLLPYLCDGNVVLFQEAWNLLHSEYNKY